MRSPLTLEWFKTLYYNGPFSDGSQEKFSDRDVSSSIFNWVMALMFSAVVGLILLAGFAKLQTAYVYDKAIYSNTSTVPGVVAIEEAKVHFVQIGELLYRHVYSDNSKEKAELGDKIAQQLAISLEYLQEYESLVNSAEDMRLLQNDRAIYLKYQQALALILHDSRANRRELAKLNLLVLGDVEQSLIQTFDIHIRSNIDVGNTSRTLAENSLSQSIWRSLLFVAGLIAILLILGYITSKRLLRQANKLQSLERESAMFRNMVDQLKNVAVTVHDANNGTRIIYANDVARNHFGVDIKTLLTWTPRYFQAEVNEHETPARIDQKVANGSATFETFHRIVSGEVISLEVVSNIFKHEGRELNLCFISNISERKAAANAREAALTEAKRLARLRSEFIAQMSHELRTPLNGILGYAQILQRKVGLSEQQVKGLTVIQQSGEHLLMLINDILDFAKVEANKLELDLSDIQPEQFLHTIANIISIKAEQKHLAFTLETVSLPDVIRADNKRLRQVLLNLLANAVKFTSQGQVCLRVSLLSPTLLRFEVQDTGSGIDENQLESIFQPFEQTNNGKHWVEGTGLGLAISRQLARLMGSEIKVKSQINQGSTFWFDLKLQVEGIDSAIDLTQWNATDYKEQQKMLLVIGDVTNKRGLAVNKLDQIDVEVTEALYGLGGRAGVSSYKKNDPLVTPSQAKLKELHSIALRGNMQKIVNWAISLAELDERYQPFSDQLLLLAKGFESKSIVNFVEHCLKEYPID